MYEIVSLAQKVIGIIRSVFYIITNENIVINWSDADVKRYSKDDEQQNYYQPAR